MTLFLSTFINKIDRKGRVSVPAPFRAALAEQSFQGVVLFCAHAHPCIEGFPHSFMAELSDRLDHFDLFSPEQDDLATSLFGESVQLPFDGDGRIILPPPIIDYAGIDDQCAFVGMGRKFQIWNPISFKQRKEEARDNIRKNGVTLPKSHVNNGGAA